jgi:hypothetical protein
MSWSLFEARDQFAEQERRRQEIAAQQAQPTQAMPPAAAAMAGQLTGGMPLAGPAPGPMAVKATEPDIAKRKRKGKEGGKPKGRDMAAEEPAVTGPQAVADGHMDAVADEASRKSFRDRGASEGPGGFREPGRVDAEEFDRDYISEGHASESPVSGAPRQMPIIHAPQGHVQPIELPGALVAGYVPARVSQALSMGSPSDR